MCRWLTYVGTPVFLDSLLYDQENSLVRQSLEARQSHITTNGDGFGIGQWRPVPPTSILVSSGLGNTEIVPLTPLAFSPG
jgi:predicted glutamine amidotransferase